MLAGEKMRTVITMLLMLGCAVGQTLSPEVRNFVKTDAPLIALTHVRVIDGTGSARAYVLEVGRVAVSGSSEELSRAESVRKSYLGY
jgi:ABC-type branched-subunit amino acid transport system ATPase component